MIEVYKSAFAEEPWNEYMKCSSCSVEYNRQEVQRARDYCKKCGKSLELIEFWSAEEIVQDLEFALSQKDTIVLIAENSDGLAGFTWGYKLPLKKFPFLKGRVKGKVNYMDEIAVRGNKRQRQIGTLLGKNYLETAEKQGISEVVLRTDERNVASMALFRRLGFSDILDSNNPKRKIYDPEFPNRIYLKKRLGE